MAIFLGVLLLAVLAPAWSHELDLDRLESQLAKAGFQSVPIPVADKNPKRFNILGWLKSKNFCMCDGQNVCTCCVEPNLFNLKVPACINFIFVHEEKRVEVGVTIMEKEIVKHSFPMSPREDVAGKLPGKASFLGFRLHTETTGNVHQTVSMCTSLQVLVKAATAVEVSFNCIQLVGTKISFVPGQQTQIKSVISIKMKNPFKAVVDFLKRVLHK